MKAKISLLGRVDGQFVAIPFKKNQPVVPEGATSFYARFSEDGKRVCQALGQNFADALVAFRNLEISREFKSRNLPVPAQVSEDRTETLHDTISRYSEEVESNKARKTAQAYKNSLALFQKSCHKTTVGGVTREDLLAYKNYLRGQQFMSRSIYNNFLNVMVFLRWAGVRTEIKSADWPMKPFREPEEYTEEEVVALLNAADKEERLLLNCFLCSGMRSGELAHLTYGDIDFKHSTITVQPKDGWQTKTRESQRDIPVPEWLTAKLAERQKDGSRAKSDLVFFNREGKPNLHMLRITKAVAKRAKLTGRVDDHKFRSTAVTRWLRTPGVTVPDVMAWVGHTNPAIIMHYAKKVNLQNRENHQKATRTFAQFAGVGD